MSVLVVRHGLSEANDKNSAAFGQAHAELLPLGIEQARESGLVLVNDYGIDFTKHNAAASNMLRSQQTAYFAGFAAVKNYVILNEVDVPKTPELRAVLDRGELISEARRAAVRVLENPPEETVWFSHGYLIAALCELTGADTTGLRFIPRFGEVRELPI